MAAERHPELRICGFIIGIWACGLDERQLSVADVDALEPGASVPAASSLGDASGGSSADAGASELGTATVAPCLDCIVPECTPGAAECSSGTELAECDATGLWTPPNTCTFVCANAACAGECAPAATECVTTVRYRQCSPQGVWSEPIDCENACVGAGCAGECKPAATRCISTAEVQTCSDQGAWLPATACRNACSGAACTGECTPGSARCATDTQLQSCNELGQWVLDEVCPLACVGTSCGGECAPGSRRCGPGGLPQLCSTGTWQDEPACPFVCVGNGSCGGECTPGSRRCNPATGIPQQCGTSAVWQNQAPCDFVCTGEGSCTGECLPNTRRCSASGRPQVCSNAFRWLDEQQCPFACTGNGSCTGECQNGQSRCGPTGIPQQCVNASWQNQAACGGSQVCQGQGACGCAQGFTSCSVGSCTNTASDANHCGQCGRSCLGAECSAAVCQELELTSNQSPSFNLTQRMIVDGANVYWINVDSVAPNGIPTTSIRRVSKEGGAVQTIVAGELGGISSFALTGNEVFWANNTSLLRGNLTLGPRVLAASNRTSVNSVVISGDSVYWGLIDNGIFRRPTATGGATPESIPNQTTTQSINAMRALGTCVYYEGGSPSLGGAVIRRACVGGTGGDDLFRTMSNTIEGFDADSSGVYFELGSGTIFRVPLTPGQTETPVLQSTSFKTGLALDDTFIYFVETANNGIWRVPKSGDGQATIFANPVARGAQPDSVVTDNAAVYWVDEGRIFKKAK